MPHLLRAFTTIAVVGALLTSTACSASAGHSSSGSTSPATRVRSAQSTEPHNISTATQVGAGGDADAPLSLSCASATFCVAASGASTDWLYDGQSWNAYTGPVIQQVSCIPGPFCLAITGEDRTSYATTTDGTHWTSTPLPPNIGGEIACHSAQLCVDVAVDANAQDFGAVYDGQAWSTPQQLSADSDGTINPGAGMLQSASCNQQGQPYCLVVGDYNGKAVAWPFENGTFSTGVQVVDNEDEVSSVTCPAIESCLFTTSRTLFSWTGTSATEASDQVGEVGTIGCATATRCIAAHLQDGPDESTLFIGHAGSWAALPRPAGLPTIGTDSGDGTGPNMHVVDIACSNDGLCAVQYNRYGGPDPSGGITSYLVMIQL